MRILMVSRAYPPIIGGTASSTYSLVNELEKLGNKVTVVSQFGKGAKYIERGRTSIIRIPQFPIRERNIFNLFTSATLMSCSLTLLKLFKKYDVIHSHDCAVAGLATLPLTYFSKSKFAIKYSGDLVYEYHSLRNWDPNRSVEDSWKLKGLPYFIQKKLFRKFDFKIVTSNYMKKMLIKFGVPENEIKLLKNGIDFNLFKPFDKKDMQKKLKLKEPAILAGGRFVPWKGFQYLIEAAKDIKGNIYIFGSGEMEQKLKNMAKNLTNVMFLGKINYFDMWKYYNAADIFICPSLYEPFGIVNTEAMACGTPVVCSNIESLREIVKDKKLLFNPKNPKDIAEKVNKLIRNKRLRNDLIKKNLRFVRKEFDWTKIAKEFNKFYRFII